MKRAGRLFFLLTFALLQCVSPLAHAHIGGDASGGAFHVFHFNEARHPHAQDHMLRMSRGDHRFHASGLPVVKVPDGKRRSQPIAALIAPAATTAGIRLSTLATPEKFAPLERERVPLPPPHLKRYAQAPPALT